MKGMNKTLNFICRSRLTFSREKFKHFSQPQNNICIHFFDTNKCAVIQLTKFIKYFILKIDWTSSISSFLNRKLLRHVQSHNSVRGYWGTLVDLEIIL